MPTATLTDLTDEYTKAPLDQLLVDRTHLGAALRVVCLRDEKVHTSLLVAQ